MTVVVPRPIHDVFEFCRDFENFPRIIPSLVRIQDTQDGRSRWSVRTPSGRVITWEAGVTKYVPNSVIAWESARGSQVQASGLMRFESLAPEETKLDISAAYRPLKTGLTDALLAIIGIGDTKRVRAELERASRNVARTAALR